MAVVVTVMHAVAELTGMSPPVVRHVVGGRVVLEPTDLHPKGAGTVTCGACHTTFDMYLRSASELKAARRDQRRKLNAMVIPVVAVFLCSFVLAIAFFAAKGGDELAEAFKYGTWIPLSAVGVVLGLAVLCLQFFVRTPNLAVEPRTPAGLHSTRIEELRDVHAT